jgi:hypothetical protein
LQSISNPTASRPYQTHAMQGFKGKSAGSANSLFVQRFSALNQYAKFIAALVINGY